MQYFVGGIRIFKAKICINPYHSVNTSMYHGTLHVIRILMQFAKKSRYWVIE